MVRLARTKVTLDCAGRSKMIPEFGLKMTFGIQSRFAKDTDLGYFDP